MPLTFNATSYHTICDSLAEADPQLGNILKAYGYPPLWSRPNSFETLVHFILEQQVSLAAALAALQKLRERVPVFTPANIIALTDEELRACYCSRQKQAYIRNVAAAILDGKLDLDTFSTMEDEEVKMQLTALKGIGSWTADVYLMFVLARADIFPIGDLAAVNALKVIKGLPPEATRDEIRAVSLGWAPHRTIATMMLWHFYLSSRASKKQAAE